MDVGRGLRGDMLFRGFAVVVPGESVGPFLASCDVGGMAQAHTRIRLESPDAFAPALSLRATGASGSSPCFKGEFCGCTRRIWRRHMGRTWIVAV